MLNQMPTTNITEIRCQDIQWTVSKYVVVAIGIKNRIRRMFSANRIAKAVMIVLARVSGSMPAVDISSRNSR